MIIADLHIHSRYSRATSKDCDPEHLSLWARKKGIALLGTGDFTHPAWREELQEKLIPAEDGLYKLKESPARLEQGGALTGEVPRFVLSGEISSIYKKNGKVRKVHNLILLPTIEAAEILSRKLEAIGNIHSDGRPILGLDSRDLLEITLESCPEAIFVPAHIWTPHFSLFGAFSGFDTIEECFEDLTPYIHALETGLSSDPPMNWRISALDRYQLISNSDAHSPAKLGREANLLDTELSYPALAQALATGNGLTGTIEFFPEEGKYHLDGHRKCGLCLKPAETDSYGGKCPICGKKITVGVEHRIEQLADRPEGFVKQNAKTFESLVPLPEVIAASTGSSATSKKTAEQYEKLLDKLGAEFYILRKAPINEIEQVAGACVAEGIRRLRSGKVERVAGYDGEYGTIQLLSDAEIASYNGQVSLFAGYTPAIPKQSKHRLPKKPEHIQPDADLSVPLVEQLNPEQAEAVHFCDGPVAVIAGPGTGKTKTLIARIVHLIESGIKPSEITAVTFTNKAAEEMRSRLEQKLDKKTARAVTIGTFHSLCLELLQKAQPEFVLVDPNTAAEFAMKAARSVGLSSVRRLPEQISAYKNGLLSADVPDIPALTELYQQLLRQSSAKDFDDLLLEAADLPDRLGGKKKSFTHLLVDEFQDISPLQYRLIQKWSPDGKGLFVIGDPDQSIYGFRGSDAACFSRLLARYPTLHTVRFTQNYRSTPEILNCALPVISNNSGERRILFPNRNSGAQTELLTAETPLSEGIFIAKEINRMVGGLDMLDAQDPVLQKREAYSCEFSDIAVLYRTHRQAALIEKCLKKENIPYVVVGRDDFLNEPDIRGTIAFLRILQSPIDIPALQLCLQSLWNCPQDLVDALSQKWNAAVGQKKEEWYEELKAEYEQIPFCQLFFSLYQEFLPLIRKEKPYRLLIQLSKALERTDTERFQKLIDTAVFYQDISTFLAALAVREDGEIVRSGAKNYTAGAVTLMTLHAAKGLEFPAVFLCSVTKGTLPLESGHHPTDPEEERRLFYVGMTRAKEKLLLLTSNEQPSEFLAEIPSEQLLCSPVTQKKPQPNGVQLSLF